MIGLLEKEEIVKSESDSMKILNKFLSNIVKNLNIPAYNDFDSWKHERSGF